MRTRSGGRRAGARRLLALLAERDELRALVAKLAARVYQQSDILWPNGRGKGGCVMRGWWLWLTGRLRLARSRDEWCHKAWDARCRAGLAESQLSALRRERDEQALAAAKAQADLVATKAERDAREHALREKLDDALDAIRDVLDATGVVRHETDDECEAAKCGCRSLSAVEAVREMRERAEAELKTARADLAAAKAAAAGQLVREVRAVTDRLDAAEAELKKTREHFEAVLAERNRYLADILRVRDLMAEIMGWPPKQPKQPKEAA